MTNLTQPHGDLLLYVWSVFIFIQYRPERSNSSKQDCKSFVHRRKVVAAAPSSLPAFTKTPVVLMTKSFAAPPSDDARIIYCTQAAGSGSLLAVNTSVHMLIE